MSSTRLVYLALMLLAVTGCSSKQLYHSAQSNRLNACQNLPEPDRGSCLAQVHRESYEEYQRQRQAVLDAQK
ncbi:hypothetical protein IC617_16345 [Neiella sp. HB171785]|uniref:EexN family lipoprotein n=2 Tax=Neiella litorisoli TaxID=2771431 RepID=A0A8J6R402_9GAMM|nr:hypothetical protein [Neiella litorisoli]